MQKLYYIDTWNSSSQKYLKNEITIIEIYLTLLNTKNGNPLQCSCLENPRDGGAWWAAICGVTQGRTWLKQFSSRSKTKKYFEKNNFLLFIVQHQTSPLDRRGYPCSCELSIFIEKITPTSWLFVKHLVTSINFGLYFQWQYGNLR